MTPDRAQSIKNWIKSMGFKLTKKHISTRKSKRINYYTLDNFGIYEEISAPVQVDSKAKAGNQSEGKQKFISWTPWGDDVEITSVRDISKAYENFFKYNPDVVVN